MKRVVNLVILGVIALAASVSPAQRAGVVQAEQVGPFNVVSLGPFGTPGPGNGLDMAIGQNGYPIVAYTVDGALLVQVCQDPDCSSRNERTFNFDGVDVDFPNSAGSYMALDGNGVPTFVARAKDNSVPLTTPDSIVFIRCTNSVCTDATIKTVYEGIPNNFSVAHAIVEDNKPLVVARSDGTLRAWFLGESDPDFTESILAPHENQGDVDVEYAPGRGTWVVYNAPGYDLTVAKCADTPCSSLQNHVVLKEGDPSNNIFPGFTPSLDVDGGGWRVVHSVQDQVAANDLYITHSESPDFSGELIEENAFGEFDKLHSPKTVTNLKEWFLGVSGTQTSSFGPGFHLVKCDESSCADFESLRVTETAFAHALAVQGGDAWVAWGEDRGSGFNVWLGSAATGLVFPETNSHTICVVGPGDVPVEDTRVTLSRHEDNYLQEVVTGNDGCAGAEIPAALENKTIKVDTSPREPDAIDKLALEWSQQADMAYMKDHPELFEIRLDEVRGQPPEVKITQSDSASGVPVIPNQWPVEMKVENACAGGLATAERIVVDPQDPSKVYVLAEGPPGTYQGTAAPFGAGNVGTATIEIDVDCPGAVPDLQYYFEVFVDPTAYVRTTGGAPIANAQVILLRATTDGGTFGFVQNGSTIMAPANRSNGDFSDVSGRFGWSTVAGFYKARVLKAGCTAPGGATTFADSAVVQTWPEVLDVEVVMECSDPAVSVVDANCDGAFNLADVLTSRAVLAGVPTDQTCELDVDRNGQHTAEDVLMQLRMLVGLAPNGPQ